MLLVDSSAARLSLTLLSSSCSAVRQRCSSDATITCSKTITRAYKSITRACKNIFAMHETDPVVELHVLEVLNLRERHLCHYMLLCMRLTRLSSCTSWRSFCALYVAASCFAAFFLCSASASRSLAISRIYMRAIFLYKDISIYVCMYVCMCVCMYVSIYLSVFVCMFVCVYVCICLVEFSTCSSSRR